MIAEHDLYVGMYIYDCQSWKIFVLNDYAYKVIDQLIAVWYAQRVLNNTVNYKRIVNFYHIFM
jgi:hypothetical protein